MTTVSDSIDQVAATNARRLDGVRSIIVHRTSLEGLDEPVPDEHLDGVTLARAFAPGGPLASITGGACPYHVIVRRDGVAEQLLPLDRRGAHARWHNARTIGVAYVGFDRCTSLQYATLARVVAALLLATSAAAVQRHDDLSGVDPDKVCPHRAFSVGALAWDADALLPTHWRRLLPADAEALAVKLAPGLRLPEPMRRHHA